MMLYYKKIKNYFKYREKRKSYGMKNPDKNFFVIRRKNNDAGLMSIIITTLAQIKIAEERNLIPIIDMMNYDNIYLSPSDKYKENSWEYFFEQINGEDLKDVYESKNVILSDGRIPLKRPGDWMSFYNNKDGELDYWKRLFLKYIKIKKELLILAQNEFDSHIEITDKIIGVCCRGAVYNNLKAKGHPIQPSIDMLIRKVEEIMKEREYSKVYVATEDEEIISAFRMKFGEKFFCKEREYNSKDDSLKDYINKFYNRKIGEDYLIQLLMLSKCNYLVSSRCSGSVGVSLMENSFEDKYIFDLGEFE